MQPILDKSITSIRISSLRPTPIDTTLLNVLVFQCSLLYTHYSKKLADWGICVMWVKLKVQSWVRQKA